ncbi:MAG: hypothetical protein PHC77_07615, partial [Candidatus Marinimicrobia bacterium]|nr:hypothetical protein [Candidatus Neomarinimicrobiota bacterium]
TVTINGVPYTGWSNTMPEPVDGKKYFIYYLGKQKGHFEIDGENDWSDTTAINLPFSKTGAGRFTFSTDQKIASVTSSNMDTLLINEMDYTNQSTVNLPAKMDGLYYIYYSASSEYAELTLEKGLDTTSFSMPYSLSGVGEFYLKTNGTITSIQSNNTESVTINGVNYTNIYSAAMPERIDSYYYIYYRASVSWAALNIDGDDTPVIENDTINVPLPYRYDGSGKHYFATPGTITSILSSNTDLVSINGVNITNTTATSMPPRIDGWYYVYYNASKTWAYIEIEGDTIPVVENDTIKINVMPFEYNGIGKHYFWTDGTITSIQSNGADSVSVNGSVITNTYTTVMPDRINGSYYIYYNASQTYAALLVEGDTTPVAPPDTTEITLPFTHSGPDERYFAISDNVAFMNSWGMDVLTVNGMDFTNATNVTESMLPSRLGGYYYVYYRSNKSWAEFSVTGSVKLYVDADPGDGAWTEYYSDLALALDEAVSGQEIWVAEGTYFPGSLRSDSFVLKAGVKIYGGFKGGESTLGQRNVWNNPTILSGDIGVENDNSDNAYHVVSAAAAMTTVNTVLDGFVIRDGYADDGSGGAGFLFSNGASPLIRNCIVENNSTTGNGGAIAIGGIGTVAPRFEFCLFDGNSAVNGGLAYLSGSNYSLNLHRITAVNNTASANGGALYAGTAAIAVSDSSIFWNNTAAASLQSLYSDAGNVTTQNTAADDAGLPGTVTNVTFYSSQEEDGPFKDLINFIPDLHHGISPRYGYREGLYRQILNIRILLEGGL